jgi:TRAP transporter TAXI family solute receptor
MRRFFSRDFLLVFIPAAAICVGAVWFALRYVKPAPPTTFVMTTANKTSPYYMLAMRIKEEVAKKGVDIEVRESAASSENLRLLKDPDSGVQAGFVQGGLSNHLDAPNLFSMGRVITEPVWIFFRGAEKLDHITQLKGKRILVGPDKSGTNVLALKLLDANGVTTENSTLINLPLSKYAETFEKGDADAGFMVIGAESGPVQTLLNQPGTTLMNMAQADALIQRYPYLTSVTLRQGVVDFAKNIPPADTALVATKAMLLVRDDLHPALITVLAQGILSVQSQPSLKPTGESRLFALGADALADDPEFPMVEETRRVYKSGPTFFWRVLPFWLATLLDRAFILLLPVVGVIFPLFRIVPFVYNWRMRRRILRWYTPLKALERDLEKTGTVPDFVARKERELDHIEESVWRISVPGHLAPELYTLRDHVEFVRRRIAAMREAQGRAKPQPVMAK